MWELIALIKESPLLRNLQHEKANNINYLVNGNLDNFGEYRFYAGKIQGIQVAIDILENLFVEENTRHDDRC